MLDMRCGSKGGPIAMPPAASRAMAAIDAERTVMRARDEENPGSMCRKRSGAVSTRAGWAAVDGGLGAEEDLGEVAFRDGAFSVRSLNVRGGSFKLLTALAVSEVAFS